MHTFRQFLIILLICIILFPAGAYAVAVESPQQTRLVKSKSLPIIYAVIDGKKMRIPRKAFTSKIFSLKDVQTISSKELLKIPRVKYVQSEQGTKVYALSATGKKSEVGKESTVAATIATQIVEIPEEQIELFEEITVLKNLSENSFGTVPGSFVKLGNPSPFFGHELKINNKGQVLAASALWDKGVQKDFNEYGVNRLAAIDFNDNGQIVGAAYLRDKDSDSRPFIIDNGQFQWIGGAGFFGTALDINNKGQVVGTHAGAGGGWQRAFLWENGKVTELGSLGGGDSSASKINDNGQVIGLSNLKAGEYDYYGFFWENGKMTKIDSFGGNNSYATDLNNAGQVIGHAAGVGTKSDLDFPSYPFIWQSGVMKKLPMLELKSINNNGQVLGSYYVKPRSTQFPYGLVDWGIWQNDEIVRLSTIMYPKKEDADKDGGRSKSQLPYLTPHSMNDTGQIVGEDNQSPMIFTLPNNIPPQLRFTKSVSNIQIDGIIKKYLVEWDDADIDDNAKISLYYFVHPINEAGNSVGAEEMGYRANGMNVPQLMVADLPQDGKNTYLFDISKLPKGYINIYAIIDDGTNPPYRVNPNDNY